MTHTLRRMSKVQQSCPAEFLYRVLEKGPPLVFCLTPSTPGVFGYEHEDVFAMSCVHDSLRLTIQLYFTRTPFPINTQAVVTAMEVLVGRE